MPEEEFVPPIEIPFNSLSAEALQGVIDNFIQREGTDYGVVEMDYEKKIQQVQKQIQKGDVKIVFDPHSESVTLMTLHEWKKRSRNSTSGPSIL